MLFYFTDKTNSKNDKTLRMSKVKYLIRNSNTKSLTDVKMGVSKILFTHFG